MALPRAPLWLWAAVLGSFVPAAFCGSSSHSLCYFYLKLPEPSQGLPQFFIWSYLDEQPIARFDSLTSLTRKMEPLVPWMEGKEKGTFLALEWIFRPDLEKLSKLDHQTGGPPTWQVTWGCELREDGSKGGFLHYGYNGWDFISFNKETLRWVTAQAQAQKVKEKWEEDPRWSQRNKLYLEETCIEWLQWYLSYRRKIPQRIEPPVGKVTHKVIDDNLEILTCQAFGFYPKEIQATWTRDGEACKYQTLRRNVAPNSDGTYYVQLSIEIDPKERDRFWCYLEHISLQEPLVLALKEETATGWRIPVGVFVAAIISGAGMLFLIDQWRRRSRKDFHPNVTTCPDQDSLEKLTSPPTCAMEDETHSDQTLQLNITSEHNTTHRRRRPKRAPEDIDSALSNGTWQQSLTGAADPVAVAFAKVVAAAGAAAVAAARAADNARAAAVGGGDVQDCEYHLSSHSGEAEVEAESE